ncbi:MAG TPA: ABC transporter permease [Cyclobacteriaceae bacterium]|nr:ABC transporter permease [Cyclobacteriaceae bacterium]
MLKNNFKLAIRSLLRQKGYTFINIVGLAVGIASCLLIALFVQNEFSYDKFYKDADQVHKMVLERIYPDHSTYYSGIPHSFANVAVRDYAEIESATLLVGPFGNTLISYKNERDEKKEFEESFVFAADSNFFSIFSFKIIKGDEVKLLHNANDMVMTESTALRYFGDEDPIGKTITTGFGEFTVTAVCEDVPDNSHMKFDMLVSLQTFPFIEIENFTGFSANCYFKLIPGADYKALESKFPQMVETYASAQIERDLGKSWEDYKKEGNGYRYFLQPLTSIHLDPTNLEGKIQPGGNITSVYIMISVAILILFIACINFMNLATARSAERAKEVGVRKTMGSFKKHLVFQFLTESFVLSFIGVALAVIIIILALPYFNDLTGKSLQLIFSPLNITVLLGITIFVGFLAGVYPSFVLSSFNPVVVLKGNFTGNQKGQWIRNSLVIFQFWISIVLMIGTLVIQQQMTYMREKSLGFDKDQMLVVERMFNLDSQTAKTYVEELRRSGSFVDVSGSGSLPGRQSDFFGIQFQPEGSSEILTTKSMVVSDRMPEILGLELLEGKWFYEDTNDSLTIVLNESAAKVMGYKDPIGRKLNNIRQTLQGNISLEFTVIGVVKDFNFQSLHDQVTPLVIQNTETFGGGMTYALARVKPGQIQEAIQMAESKWREIAPEQPFKFTFLDEDLKANYEADQRTGKLFAVFSGLAIFVACIGLFALSAYTASLRTKEIGIRKVLGASTGRILALLSKDFTKMVLISFLMAIPVAWFVMENWWLQNFAYRIQISVWTILISGAAAFLVAGLTVSFQSIKAAVRNPVQSLRSQ